MFKKMIKSLVMTGLVAITFGALPALAEDESPVSASADVSILSQYVWRGIAFSDSSIVIQPSVTVAYGGFGINLWGNLDTDSAYIGDNDFNETDLTLSYDWSAGDMVSMGAGYIYYAVPGANTKELYFTVGLDTILAPSLTIYRDIDAAEGWYINLGIGHSISFTDDISLDLAASVGYSDVDDYSEFHDGVLSASMTFSVNDYISITPSVTYTMALNDDFKTALELGPTGPLTNADSETDHFFGGVTCSISF